MSTPPDAPPLPLAAVRRRALNGKGAEARHLTAYHLWEAALRLRIAVLPPDDPAPLALPSIGHFARAATSATKPLSDPRALHLHTWLAQVARERAEAPRHTSVAKLAELLAGYRNKVIGHGAARASAFYEEGATALLEGFDAAWSEQAILPPRTRLAFIDEIAIGTDGARTARVLDLQGYAPLYDPAARDLPDGVLPKSLVAWIDERIEPLEPWLVFDPTELRERVLFFNGRVRGGARYLDYVGGEEVRGEALAAIAPRAEALCEALFERQPPSERAEPAAPSGDFFGDYQLLGKLGEGGMGVVYLARQIALDRLVALKMLPAVAGDDALAVARFEREVTALSRCDHPNVVKILAAGKFGATRYYAMELVDGPDLAELVSATTGVDVQVAEAVSTASRRRREAHEDLYAHLPIVEPSPHATLAQKNRWDAIATLFRDAARAVDYLHRQGIVHRDLKPANLMVAAGDHRLVVMDLGIAMLGDATRTLTRDRDGLLGTLRYMPPEQLERRLVGLDHRADVYSLGATFYELCAGRPRFDGHTEAQLVHQVLNEPPADARTIRPDLPADLSAILRMSTQKDPRLRYPSAEALAQDLDDFLARRPIRARDPSLFYVIALAARRHRALSALSLAALAASIALGVVWAGRERSLRDAAAAEAERARAEQQHAEEAQARAEGALVDVLAERGRSELVSGEPLRAARYLYEAYRLDPHGPEVAYLLRRALGHTSSAPLVLDTDSSVVIAIAFSPGGARLLYSNQAGEAHLVDSFDGRSLAEPLRHDCHPESLGFAPDHHLLTLCAGVVRVFPPRGGEPVATLDAPKLEVVCGHEHDLLIVSERGIEAFGTDGTRHASFIVSPRGRADAGPWWEARGEGLPITQAELQEARRTGFLLRASRQWQHRLGGELARRGERWVQAHGAVVEVWEAGGAPPSQPSLRLVGHRDLVTAAALARDGRVASASLDGRLRIWPRRRDDMDAEIGLARGVDGMALLPRGMVAAAGALLSADDATVLRPACFGGGAHRPRASAGGGRVVANGHVCDVATGAEIASLPSGDAALSADGSIAAVARGSAVELWSVEPRELVRRLEHTAPVFDLQFSSTARELLAVVHGRHVELWSRDGELIGRLTHEGPVEAVAFGRDPPMAVTAGNDRVVRVWSLSPEPALQFELRGHLDSVVVARLSLDGRLLVTGGYDRTARLWSPTTGALRAVLEGHEGPVLAAALDELGRRVFTGAADGKVRVFSADSGLLLASWSVPSWPLDLAVARQGRRLIVHSADGALRVYDVAGEARSPEELAPLIEALPFDLVDTRVVPR